MLFRILLFSSILFSHVGIRTEQMQLSQLDFLSIWESNLASFFLRDCGERNRKYSKEHYSRDASDLSGARKLKTFIKGRFLPKNKKQKNNFIFLLPESQIVFRMCKLEADWISAAAQGLGLLNVKKTPNYEPIDLSALRRLICHELLSYTVVINTPCLLKRGVEFHKLLRGYSQGQQFPTYVLRGTSSLGR